MLACNTTDSTDISGTYAGNATYTISPTMGDGSVGAASASVDVATDDDGVEAGVAPDCLLDGRLDVVILRVWPRVMR